MHGKALQILFSILLLAIQPIANGLTIHKIWEKPYKHGIAAIVQDRIITFEELRREMAPLMPQIRAESVSPADYEKKMEELYMEILQALIDRALIIKDFKEKEFQIPETVIENEYDRILITDFNNDRQKFHEHLRQIGKSPREFREGIEERVIVGAMRNQIRKSQAAISPEKIEEFYNENKIHFYQEESIHLRIIMLKPQPDSDSGFLDQTASKVIQELKNGADFSELAKKYSHDSRKDRGGDWGWVKRGDLRTELSTVAFGLASKKFSEPIELNKQLFILYIEDKRDEGIQSLSEARNQIEEILAGKLAGQAQNKWLERLRRDAYIKYY